VELDGVRVLVMELVEGKTLDEMVAGLQTCEEGSYARLLRAGRRTSIDAGCWLARTVVCS